MSIQTIGFIGLGLIGGSIARAVRKIYPEMTLIGYNRSKESLAAALEDGTLNQAQNCINESFSVCDIIFLCAPVSVNIRCMKDLKDIVQPGCLMTDVGSVKTSIHEAVKELGMEEYFIGGHPMTGSEKFGYVNASDRLLENAYYILTPTGKNPKGLMDSYIDLVSSIGAIPIVLDYREHDRVTAAISHLPHLMAYALVNLVKESDNPEGLMRMLAAGGFKDITRIASSSPEMWQQICSENSVQVQAVLLDYIHDLQQIQEAIAGDDRSFLIEYFDSARKYRDSIPKQFRGSIEPLHEIHVDITDEPGAISIISTILGAYRVSIRNLEIQHNRENQDGALRIEFYNADSAAKSAEVLKRFNYTVYER